MDERRSKRLPDGSQLNVRFTGTRWNAYAVAATATRDGKVDDTLTVVVQARNVAQAKQEATMQLKRRKWTDIQIGKVIKRGVE